jgi:hypothetical protein
LVELPLRKIPITTKWVYKVKNDSTSKPSKCKASLMAKRFQKKEGLYFQKTFALIIKWNTIKTVI